MENIPVIQEEVCREILMDLLRIDSSQPEGNEKNMVDAIVAMFPEGTQFTRIVHTPQRHSLILTIPGACPENAVAFVGHIDTVPCGDLNKWESHPLQPTEDQGKIRGRGSADMKGGVAAMIAAAKAILASGITMQHTVLFCFTADEENGGLGAKALLQREEFACVREIWITEPTNGEIGVCEKGALWLKFTAQGKSAHASRPELGKNALDMLVRIYQELCPKYHHTAHHPLLGDNTLSLTRLQGGVSTNIIPDHGEMELDIRTLPVQDHQTMLEEIRAVIARCQEDDPQFSVTFEVTNNRPAIEQDERDPLIENIKAICEEMHRSTNTRGIHFYTDGSQLVPFYKKPFVILGPGNDAMAHQINECVEVKEVLALAQLYTKYLCAFN